MAATVSAAGAEKYLEYVWKLPAAAAVRITALIELGGGWEAFAERLIHKNPTASKEVGK